LVFNLYLDFKNILSKGLQKDVYKVLGQQSTTVYMEDFPVRLKTLSTGAKVTGTARNSYLVID